MTFNNYEMKKLFDFILINKNIVLSDYGLFSRDTLILLRDIIKGKKPNDFVLSKNQENAYKFIDYLLREDVMTKIIEGYPYKNVNAKADNILPSSYISNTSSNFSKEILKNSYMVKNIGEKVKLYDQIWTSIK